MKIYDISQPVFSCKVYPGAEICLPGNESQSVGPEDAPVQVHKQLLEKEIALFWGCGFDRCS